MPEVRTARELPWGHGALNLAGRYRLGRILRALGYTWSIVLPTSALEPTIPLSLHSHQTANCLEMWRLGLTKAGQTPIQQYLVWAKNQDVYFYFPWYTIFDSRGFSRR